MRVHKLISGSWKGRERQGTQCHVPALVGFEPPPPIVIPQPLVDSSASPARATLPVAV